MGAPAQRLSTGTGARVSRCATRRKAWGPQHSAYSLGRVLGFPGVQQGTGHGSPSTAYQPGLSTEMGARGCRCRKWHRGWGDGGTSTAYPPSLLT